MTLRKAPLRKLIQLFYAQPNLRTSIIRDDIRRDIAKAAGVAGRGGDFYSQFWADAKRHVLGSADLNDLVEIRVAENAHYRRLYPLHAEGFLRWWNERRRWRNEPLIPLPTLAGTQFGIPEVETIVKVESTLALESGPDFHRVIYPYFSEEPQLPLEGARLAVWAMTQALPHYNVEDLRVLDVLRGNSFGTPDFVFDGHERELFIEKQQTLLREWDRLRAEY